MYCNLKPIPLFSQQSHSLTTLDLTLVTIEKVYQSATKQILKLVRVQLFIEMCHEIWCNLSALLLQLYKLNPTYKIDLEESENISFG